jgi:hypothetical protein
MHREWLAFEHYRIHMMELWPDGPGKEAGLSAARSGIENLTRAMSNDSSFRCATCDSRRRTVIAMPLAPRNGSEKLPSALAA